MRGGIDPAVLVALIGVGGTTLTTLLTAIFGIMERARAARLTVKFADGRTIDIPASYPAGKFGTLLAELPPTVTAISLER